MIPAAARWAVGAMLAVSSPLPATSGPWLDVSPPGTPAHPLVELDVSSIHRGLLGPEAVIRVTRRASQAHGELDVAYRSWRMHVLFQCTARQVEPLAVSFFSGARGQGQEVGVRTNLGGDGIPDDLLAALSPAVPGSMLRAACARDSVHHR